MTAAQLLTATIARLRAAGVVDAPGDARRLLARALGVPPRRLTLVLPDLVPAGAADTLEPMVVAREERRPVSQILGGRLFFGRNFKVTPDVLDPRPETEVLIETALNWDWETVLDLGTGSGCILLSLLAERAGARGLGVDISEAALRVARENRDALGLAGRADLRPSDWEAAVEGRFDLVVSNPPYIGAEDLADLAPEVRLWEPAGALSPGADALAAYRRIAGAAAGLLHPGGCLAVEVGLGQAGDVAALFAGAGLTDVAVRRDLDGRARVVTARKPAG